MTLAPLYLYTYPIIIIKDNKVINLRGSQVHDLEGVGGRKEEGNDLIIYSLKLKVITNIKISLVIVNLKKNKIAVTPTEIFPPKYPWVHRSWQIHYIAPNYQILNKSDCTEKYVDYTAKWVWLIVLAIYKMMSLNIEFSDLEKISRWMSFECYILRKLTNVIGLRSISLMLTKMVN